AMMSHEVRTPLHAIMGVTEMMQDTILKAEQRELIDLIQEQSQNLLTMLNSILDYSKLEAHKMILEKRAFKIKDFMEVVTKQFKGQAWSKGIELQIFIDAPDNLYIYGDVQRLRQVITAFASNAIKFTNEGSVIVTCILLKKTETQATLHFGVADTGIGIPEDKIQTLFSPFIQADSSHTRHYGGTGLGLAIAHRILKLMKSTIRVTSIVDDGTTFEFEINFDRADLHA
ncbi:MAG: ATP-binding protein, partial [Phototrophicaceae bacterium]